LSIATCVVVVAAMLAPGSTSAAHRAGGGKGAGGGTAAKTKTEKPPKTATEKREEKEENGEETQLREPAEGSTATSLASELGSSGQVDPISGLGLRNPVCDRPSEIHAEKTRVACETDGMPEALYPVSNYGFDVFIPTGVTHPVGDIMAGLTTMMNGVWLGLLFVLKLVLTLLGLAFSLNPFSNGPTMAKISEGIEHIYLAVTDPWLSVLVVCGGVWLAYKGLLKREVSASVAGTILAVAMLVLGLWIVNRPRETVGELATFSDEVALSVISAPQSGGLSHPVGSYAEAMSRVWNQMVEVPFAGLDFSDLRWALGPPPEEAVKKANEAFCEDNSALTALAELQNIGIKTEEQCAKFAEERYGKPKSVLDLYLRSSPNSAARNALWNYFDNDDKYKPKVAAQGGDGVMTRLSMLALFALGLAGALFLLAWLAVRLFTQAAIAFVLLLAAPFALFFPLLGDAGRRAFKEWGLTLLGAVLAKVIYAAFLSVVMLGITVLGTALGGGATGFLLAAAFSWAVFLKRSELVGFMTIEPTPSGGAASLGADFAAYKAARLGGRLVGAPLQVAGGLGRRTGRLVAHRVRSGDEATREAARGALSDGARALADERYREAQRKVEAYEWDGQGNQRPKRRLEAEAENGSESAARALKMGWWKGSDSTGSSGSRTSRPDGRGGSTSGSGSSGSEADTSRRKEEGAGTGSGGGAAGPKDWGGSTPPAPWPQRVSEQEYRDSKDLIARADERQERQGERWSENDLARFAEEDRKLIREHRDPADHAQRAGYERERFEAMKGPERVEAEEKIWAAVHRDERRLALDENPAGFIVGRPRQMVERLRQTPRERREALRRIRREQRDEKVARRRKNLSRGG
jgi:hypothetical protein